MNVSVSDIMGSVIPSIGLWDIVLVIRGQREFCSGSLSYSDSSRPGFPLCSMLLWHLKISLPCHKSPRDYAE